MGNLSHGHRKTYFLEFSSKLVTHSFMFKRNRMGKMDMLIFKRGSLLPVDFPGMFLETGCPKNKR